jgi:hypothetical protein
MNISYSADDSLVIANQNDAVALATAAAEAQALADATDAAALATAAVVGGTTAITVTVGTQLMYYTIEYGGALTKSAATAIAEAYLDYKGKHGSIIQSATPFECTATDLTDVSGESRESSNWLILDVAMPPSDETEELPPPLQPI